MSKSTKATSQIQIDRFKEAARQLEVDDSEAAFNEQLKNIANQKKSLPEK